MPAATTVPRVLLLTACLLACGGSSESSSSGTAFTVGGSVSGLSSGASVVLLDNGADSLTVSANGGFTFATALASGASYLVTVGTQPSGETCTVAGGGPSAISADVTGVVVTCAAGAALQTVEAERALAQTGLAIGLASTVLQSQIQLILTLSDTDTSCSQLMGGGSVQLGTKAGAATVFYDDACTKPYVTAQATVTSSQAANGDATVTASETATYFSPGDSIIGTMTLNEAIFSPNGSTELQLHGLGVFTPAHGTTPVQLGLYCTIPATDPNATSATAQCGGGIAQDFPLLNLAIGAVTPLDLTIPLDASGDATNVTFAGGGTSVAGPLGSLTLTNPAPASLVIDGGSSFATTTSSGGAAQFTLFPPQPTAWTLSDAAHDQKFSISVVDNTVRNLAASIVQISTGATLATATLDQSGTGTVTWSDGSTAAITSWTLAD
jgi:hypothetical protein